MNAELTQALDKVVERISRNDEYGRCTNPHEVVTAVKSFLRQFTTIDIICEFEWSPQHRTNRLKIYANKTRHFVN